MQPATLALTAQRWVPFVYAIDFEGFDLSAATFAMQVRLYRDAPNQPIINLTNAAPQAEGISVKVATVDGVTTSSVQIRINETTIENTLPFTVDENYRPSRIEPDVTLVWDLVISGPGLGKARWLQGSFIIEGGVTQ